MRGYGKRSSSVIVVSEKVDKCSNSDLSDSSDDDRDHSGNDTHVNEVQLKNGEQESVKVDNNDPMECSKKTLASSPTASNKEFDDFTLDLHDEKREVDTKHSSSVVPMELVAFDFLEETNLHKRRRTNYQKSIVIEESEDSVANINSELSYSVENSEINETIEGLDSFLMSLQKVKKNKLGNEFELEDEITNPINSKMDGDSEMNGKRLYGRRRTLLQRQDSESEEDSEEADNVVKEEDQKDVNYCLKSKKLENSNDIKSDSFMSSEADLSTTQHFLELKHVGGVLRFEDDLEFLTSDSPKLLTEDKFISKLLNLLLTIKTDPDILNYINKHCKQEVHDWCFSKTNYKNPVISILLGSICTVIPVIIDESNIDTNIRLLTELSKQYNVPADKSISQKIVRLNYNDFINGIKPNSGITYTLKMLENNTTVLINQQQCKIIVCRLLKDYNRLQNIDQDFLLKFIQKILTNNTFELEILQEIVKSLVEIFAHTNNNEEAIKSLILLTNDPDMLTHIEKHLKQKMFEISLTFNNANFFNNEQSSIEMLLLYNGLLLNLISEFDHKLFISKVLLDELMTIYTKISSKDNKNNTEFLYDMFYLNFAHIIKTFNHIEKLHIRDKTYLYDKLRKFNDSIKEVNFSLSNKINSIIKE